MKGLKDKRFIVAGGATGMGAALAERLVAEGARIVVGDVNAPALKATVAGLVEQGGTAEAVIFDLADEASIENLVAQTVRMLGGLDGVASTAADLSAATLGNDHDVLRMDARIWERTNQVNLIGHAILMRATIPHLVAAGGGSIVLTSSANAYYGYTSHPAYSASKAGLHALMRAVARLSGKQKVRCNVVAPGLVLTAGAKVNLARETHDYVVNQMAMDRLGEPDDIASALAFFLSDESAWITGQVLSVNGGLAFRD
jgi:NAD(P)-dependent dehydrogenase (short-subunit alcohol dehydrogenase family)